MKYLDDCILLVNQHDKWAAGSCKETIESFPRYVRPPFPDNGDFSLLRVWVPYAYPCPVTNLSFPQFFTVSSTKTILLNQKMHPVILLILLSIYCLDMLNNTFLNSSERESINISAIIPEKHFTAPYFLELFVTSIILN